MNVFSGDSGKDGDIMLVRTRVGRGIFQTGLRTHEISANMACVAVLGQGDHLREAANSRDEWEFDRIFFSGEFSAHLWSLFLKQYGPVVSLPRSSPAELAFTQLLRIADKENSFEQSKAAYEFFLSWWQQLSMTWRDFTDPIQAAIRFCESQRRLMVGVSDLAKMAGMSREHFSRVFREKTGITPAAFLRTRRLRQARELILRTDLPLGEVAVRCGFASTNRLTRAYAMAFGKLPPRKWSGMVMA